MKTRTWLVIIILCALIIAGFVWYRSSAQKTYTSERSGYSFSYPKKLLTEPINPESCDAFQCEASFTTSDAYYSVQVEGIEHSLDMTITNYFPAVSSRLSDYEKTTVGGEPAYRYTKADVTYVVHGKSLYTIMAQDRNLEYSTNLNDKIYKDLLNSFTFTK